jgi:RNA polymerase sigma factor (sigma-70 family)
VTMTADRASEVIEQFRPALRKVAGKYTRILGGDQPRAHFDDLLQEGWIAMWKKAQTQNENDPQLGAILINTAKGRMIDVLRKEHYFKRGGQSSSKHYYEKPFDSDSSIWADLMGPEHIEEAATAYHDGKIMQALNSLNETERRYVYMRFWLGMSDTEIRKELGITKVWSDKQRGIRQKLSRKLHSLQGVVNG